MEKNIVTNPTVGKMYSVKDSYGYPFVKMKLLSWDNSGTCRLETKNGKIFYSHLNNLRS